MAIENQYTSPDNVTHNNAYANIKRFAVIDMNEQVVQFYLDVYHNKASKNGGATKVAEFTFTIEGEDFTTYFDPSVLKTAGKNFLSQCFEFVKTQTVDGEDFSTWTDDE